MPLPGIIWGVPGLTVVGASVSDATVSDSFSYAACSSAKADAELLMENKMAIARIERFIEFTFSVAVIRLPVKAGADIDLYSVLGSITRSFCENQQDTESGHFRRSLK